MSEPNSELIFKTLLDQNQQLGRIEGGLKSVSEKIDVAMKDSKETDKRLQSLEASHNKLKGATMAWSLIVSAVVSAAGWYFGKAG